MNFKDWLLVAVPKDNLNEVTDCLKRLRKETYWGRTVEDIVLLFLVDKPEQIRQIFLELNLLKISQNVNLVFINNLGLMG